MEPIDLMSRHLVGHCVAIISRRKHLRNVSGGRQSPDTLISYNTIQTEVFIIGQNLKSQSWNLTILHMRKCALGTQQRDRMESCRSPCTSCSESVTAEYTQVRNLQGITNGLPLLPTGTESARQLPSSSQGVEEGKGLPVVPFWDYGGTPAEESAGMSEAA